MAAYTIEEIFNGNKYSVMSEVVKEILFSGPYESNADEQTAIEMAYVKHTILVLRQMEKNGDEVVYIEEWNFNSNSAYISLSSIVITTESYANTIVFLVD